MECHDVRLLLAFTQRPCESVDAPERAAVAQHLEGCPDCAALARAERALDDALGQAMSDVLAPADLKPKVLKRVAASRGAGRGTWLAASAAAAALLLAVGLSWHYHLSRPLVTPGDVESFSEVLNGNWDEAKLKQHLSDLGLDVAAPAELDLNYLRQVDVVDFKGRRVAQLGYERRDDRPAKAIVLVLPNSQFRLHELIGKQNTVIILQGDLFTYLVYCPGGIEPFRRDAI